MPVSPGASKKGRITRVTKVHEDRDIVRVEREGDEGSGPVAEVADHRTTRSSVSHRSKGKQKAALLSPDTSAETAVVPRNDALDSQEAEELLSEAEEMLHEPIQGGKRVVTTRHSNEAGPSQLGDTADGGSADAVPDTQHQIEEVHPETVEDDTQAVPHIEEPESSVPVSPEPSVPTKSGGIMPRVKGLLSSIVHMGQEGM